MGTLCRVRYCRLQLAAQHAPRAQRMKPGATPTGVSIISGGQTGVDRGALEAALAMGVPCGGWCPAGRRAEDGVIPARFPLREMSTPAYAARTRQNILDSDATLILHFGALEGGTRQTREFCRELGKPCLVLDASRLDLAQALPRMQTFIKKHGVQVLNVAGPRASKAPQAEAVARQWVTALLASWPEGRGD